MATAWRCLEYAELEAATEGFSTLLGSGGFAHCFKGKLPDGTPVAVKRIKVRPRSTRFLLDWLNRGCPTAPRWP